MAENLQKSILVVYPPEYGAQTLYGGLHYALGALQHVEFKKQPLRKTKTKTSLDKKNLQEILDFVQANIESSK